MTQPTKQMPNAWREMQDLYAFAKWALKNKKSSEYILANILHDLQGLVENDPCFLPRTDGYYQTMYGHKEKDGAK